MLCRDDRPKTSILSLGFPDAFLNILFGVGLAARSTKWEGCPSQPVLMSTLRENYARIRVQAAVEWEGHPIQAFR
jgi:hypothetical protein